MITVKELAQEITRELSELYLRIEGDDYRQLYVERNVHLQAISELEKQLAEAKDRIAELVNLVEVQHDDNCHLADMCRQRDASIAELEATIDQLIAAGESLTRVAEWRYANLTELLAWDTLVEKIHKEREK